MMYKLRHFDIREFVPPQVYAARGSKSIETIDDRLLAMADLLRDTYGPMVINNWHFSNRPSWASALRKWSGLRIKGCPYGTIFSQHRFGRAADAIFRDYTAEQVRQDIIDNLDLFPDINAIETDVSWFHFDIRNCDRIKAFKP